ncbi:hypothetical protein L1987_25297 [Smallanthus sonchifolius]|uniref:Uncharacterized protein n=1 Tax=Smallanthus sonchifolius TaxID=185202 RepID=A0ACB9IPC1_9ASTR|nr:hypothetical protein L1987_25297 [Smallanthus sonchifolius]
MDEMHLAKQKAQEIAARLFNNAEAKRSKFDNDGTGWDSNDNRDFSSGPTDLYNRACKVWALTVGKKTEMLATGGSGAVINPWHDSTAADKEDAFRKEKESLLKRQELENVVLDANYTKAIHLAFKFRRPHKLFELFGAVCRFSLAEITIHGLHAPRERDTGSMYTDWDILPPRKIKYVNAKKVQVGFFLQH